ncbi:hypothetical protein [Bdellovibrio bacteriovorus]|uniref:hypothetical protein n=1 Tax=Bdellovibrio bacteriovorus TaxID=959 RepID=UPI0035A6A61D
MFQKVSRQRPCEICGKSDWCTYSNTYSLCRRTNTGHGKEKSDRNGDAYWVYRNGDSPASNCHQSRSNVPKRPLKCIQASSVVNQEITQILGLEKAHWGNLYNRGLRDEHIIQGEYRSINPQTLNLLLGKLSGKYPVETLLKVPGFWKDQDQKIRASQIFGMMIPVRDVKGRITAFKVRRDNVPQGENRFLLFSHKNGVSAGNELHIPIFSSENHDVIRVTEGELKADIATVLSSVKTIGIPGVSSWRSAIPFIKEYNYKRALLAFDSDIYDNKNVARAFVEAYENLKKIIKVEIEKW